MRYRTAGQLPPPKQCSGEQRRVALLPSQRLCWRIRQAYYVGRPVCLQPRQRLLRVQSLHLPLWDWLGVISRVPLILSNKRKKGGCEMSTIEPCLTPRMPMFAADNDCDMVEACESIAEDGLWEACYKGGSLGARCNIPGKMQLQLLMAIMKKLDALKTS